MTVFLLKVAGATGGAIVGALMGSKMGINVACRSYRVNNFILKWTKAGEPDRYLTPVERCAIFGAIVGGAAGGGVGATAGWFKTKEVAGRVLHPIQPQI